LAYPLRALLEDSSAAEFSSEGRSLIKGDVVVRKCRVTSDHGGLGGGVVRSLGRIEDELCGS